MESAFCTTKDKMRKKINISHLMTAQNHTNPLVACLDVNMSALNFEPTCSELSRKNTQQKDKRSSYTTKKKKSKLFKS